MPPPPKIDPSLVRQTFFDLATTLGRPATAAEVARDLEAKTEVRVSPSTIRGMVKRYGWDGLPTAAPGTRPPMEYEVVKRLGPIRAEHYRSHYWYLATAYERVQAGLSDEKGANAGKAERLVDDLKHFGDVLDYSQAKGFYVRSAWPWELGDYLAQRERPGDWTERLRGALGVSQGYLEGVEVTEDHRRAWAAALLEATEELG